MPVLARSEIQRRAHMIEQELRIAQGGEPLKEQLKSQIRDLHKSQLDENPPPAEAVERIVRSLTAQMELIDNTYRQQTLSSYQQQTQRWLNNDINTQKVSGKMLGQSSTSGYFSKQKHLPTHINCPLIPSLCRDENELFFELAAILSEMRGNYNPKVFLMVFFESIKKYEDKHGSVDGFVEKVYQSCREHRAFLSDIFALFATDAMTDLSDQLQQLVPSTGEDHG